MDSLIVIILLIIAYLVWQKNGKSEGPISPRNYLSNVAVTLEEYMEAVNNARDVARPWGSGSDENWNPREGLDFIPTYEQVKYDRLLFDKFVRETDQLLEDKIEIYRSTPLKLKNMPL